MIGGMFADDIDDELMGVLSDIAEDGKRAGELLRRLSELFEAKRF